MAEGTIHHTISAHHFNRLDQPLALGRESLPI
ncbi:hypothetical protein ABIF97_005174 [Bradyrhizobium japonicum]